MYNLFTSFLKDEEGAVTVDWVILTSGIVVLGAIVIASISSGTGSLANQIDGMVSKSGTQFIASQYW